MNTKYREDEQILQELATEQEAIVKRYFLHYQEHFVRFICNYFKVEDQMARDIYPEAFAKLFFNIKNGKLLPPLKSKLQTYLFSIGRHVFHHRYFDKFHKSVTFPTEIPMEHEHAEVLDRFEYDAQKALVKTLLEQVGEGCAKILRMAFILEYDHEQIKTLVNNIQIINFL